MQDVGALVHPEQGKVGAQGGTYTGPPITDFTKNILIMVKKITYLKIVIL